MSITKPLKTTPCDECGEDSAGVTRAGMFLCADCALEANMDLEDLIEMTLNFQAASGANQNGRR